MSGAHVGRLLRSAGQSPAWPLSLGHRSVSSASACSEGPTSSPASGHPVSSGSELAVAPDAKVQDTLPLGQETALSTAASTPAAAAAPPFLSNNTRRERWPIRHNSADKSGSSSGSSDGKVVCDVPVSSPRVPSPSWHMHSSSGKPTPYNRGSSRTHVSPLDLEPDFQPLTRKSLRNPSPQLPASVAAAMHRWATKEGAPSIPHPQHQSHPVLPLLSASTLQGLDSPLKLLKAIPGLQHSLPHSSSPHAYWLAVADLFHRAREVLSHSQVSSEHAHDTMSRLCVLLLPARIAHTRLLTQQQHQHTGAVRSPCPVPPMDAVSILFSCGQLGHMPEAASLEALVYSAISSSAPALHQVGAGVSLGATRTWQACRSQGSAAAHIAALSQAPLQAAAHLCYALSRLNYTGQAAWDRLMGHTITHLQLLPDPTFPPPLMQPGVTPADVQLDPCLVQPTAHTSLEHGDMRRTLDGAPSTLAAVADTGSSGNGNSAAVTAQHKPPDNTLAHLAAVAVALVHAKAFQHGVASGSALAAAAARPLAAAQGPHASSSLRHWCIDLIAAKSCHQLSKTTPASLAKLCGALSVLRPSDSRFWEAATVRILCLVEHSTPEQVVQLSESLARVAKSGTCRSEHSPAGMPLQSTSVQQHAGSSASAAAFKFDSTLGHSSAGSGIGTQAVVSSSSSSPAAALSMSHTGDMAGAPLADSDPAVAVLLACQRQMLYAYRSQPGTVTQQQLVRVLLAAASVGVVQPPLLELAADPLAVAFGVQTPSAMRSPQHVSTAPQQLDLPAMALIARAYTGKSMKHPQLFTAMEGCFRTRMHSADVQDVVGVLRAFTSAKYASTALYQDAAYFMGCRAHDLPSATISDVAAALARARQGDAPFFRAACLQAMSRTGLLDSGLESDVPGGSHANSSVSISTGSSHTCSNGGSSSSSSSSSGTSQQHGRGDWNSGQQGSNSDVDTRGYTHLFPTLDSNDRRITAPDLPTPASGRSNTPPPSRSHQSISPVPLSQHPHPSSSTQPQSQAPKQQDSLRMSARLLFPAVATTPQPPTSNQPPNSIQPPSAGIHDDSDFTINTSDLKSGADTRTTVMIRNIPATLHPNRLLDLIDRHCRGLYDFFYLPHDPRSLGFSVKGNKGYAFLNLASPQAVGLLIAGMQGATLVDRHIEKQVSINWSRLQGKAAMEGMFAHSTLRDQVAAKIFNLDPSARDSSSSDTGSHTSSNSSNGSRSSNGSSNSQMGSSSGSRGDTDRSENDRHSSQSGSISSPNSSSTARLRPTSKTAFTHEQLASLAMSCAMVKTSAPGFFLKVATQLKLSFPLQQEHTTAGTHIHMQHTALACLSGSSTGGTSLSLSEGDASHAGHVTSHSNAVASTLSGAGALKALWAFTTVNHPDTSLTQGLASKAAAAIMAAAEAGASTVFLLYSLAQAGVITQESKDKERELSRAVAAVLDSGPTSVVGQAQTGEAAGRSVTAGSVGVPLTVLTAGGPTGFPTGGSSSVGRNLKARVQQDSDTAVLLQQSASGVSVAAQTVIGTAVTQLESAAAATASLRQTDSSSASEPLQSSIAIAPAPSVPFPNTTLLANTLKALAVSGQSSPALSSATAALLLTRSDAFSPFALSNVAWALAKQAHHPNRAVFDLLERSILANPTHHPLLHSPIALSNIVWAFARSGHRAASATLTPVIASAAAQLVPSMGPHQAVQLFWGFTAMQHVDRPLYRSLIDRLSRCYDIDVADLSLLQTTFDLHRRLFPAVSGASKHVHRSSSGGVGEGASAPIDKQAAGASHDADTHEITALPGFLNCLLSNAAGAAGSLLPAVNHVEASGQDSAAPKDSNERWAARQAKTPSPASDVDRNENSTAHLPAAAVSFCSAQPASEEHGQEVTQSGSGVSQVSVSQAGAGAHRGAGLLELDQQGLHKLLKAVAAATALHGMDGLAPEFVAMLNSLQHSQPAVKHSMAAG